MWEYHCPECEKRWHSDGGDTICSCGSPIVPNEATLIDVPAAMKPKELPPSYLAVWSTSLAFLFVLAIVFWFAPAATCYGLPWIVLWFACVRERKWRRRFHEFQAAVCEYVSKIQADVEWFSQEYWYLQSRLIALIAYLYDRFGWEAATYAGIQSTRPYEPFDAHPNHYPDEDQQWMRPKRFPPSYLAVWSTSLAFLLVLAIAFWFAPAATCYGLPWVVLSFTCVRERTWRHRFHDFLAAVCGNANRIETDVEWFQQEYYVQQSRLIGLSLYFYYRFGREAAKNAGIQCRPPHEPFDAYANHYSDEDQQ